MAYADQPTMTPRKAVSIGLVILLHVLIGYAFVTGLAFNVIKKAAQDLKIVDVKDQPPPPEQKPPPPPPQQQNVPPPPIVAPPPKMNVAPAAPVLDVAPAPVPAPPPIVLAPPPAAPPPPSQARGARPKNQSSWAARIQENYPSDAARMEKEGRVGVRVSIGTDGRVTGCTVTSSSGTASLDRAACDGMQRYARYDPALNDSGQPTEGSASTAIVYRLN